MAPATSFPKRQAPLPESLSGRRCPTALLIICSEKTPRCFLSHLSLYIACRVPKITSQLFQLFTIDPQDLPTISA
jgi:hypothetical protein